MIKVLCFEIHQNYTNNFLFSILEGIDVTKYHWYNIDSQKEVWTDSNGGDALAEDYYTGKNFLDSIKSPHFIIFLKLQAYKTKKTFYDIHTIDDFVRSDCELLVLINDCIFVEVFSQDDDLLDKLHHNAIAKNFENIKRTNIENYGRKIFDVV